jgi:site-specific DNA recombinase
MTTTALRRVATYERVSSEDQRERETIKTQSEALAQGLSSDPTVQLVARFIDDGISGTIPMGERPQGRRLLQAAEAHEFDDLWVYNVKRLGREAVDLLLLRRRFESLGIRLYSVQEGEQTGLGYDVHAVVADFDRRYFLRISADGMNRAAREGRYTGGIVPLGYQVEGRKQTARLVPSDKIIWGDWTEADLVRKLYHWMAIDGWTCPRISRHLNALGVPTAYTRDERMVRRGQRKERTQGFWWPGRVRSIVTNPVYRGELQYGRRSTKPGGRGVISAYITPLVSPEVWEAAQVTLAANRIMSRNTDRVYLLKSVIRCGCCGRYYVGCWSRKYPRYRCNGQLTDRRPIQERCPSKTVKGPDLEPVVWDDIQRFLCNPGDILEELEREREMDQGVVIAEAEMVTLETAMAELAQRKKKAIDLNLRNRISDEELDELLVEIYREQEGMEQRLRELQASLSESPEPLNVDLLSELRRRRLDEGLSERERQEIVQLLVKRITVYTEIIPEGKKAKVLIQYRFPGVVTVSTGRGSGQPR